jgi:hypothetical protein
MKPTTIVRIRTNGNRENCREIDFGLRTAIALFSHMSRLSLLLEIALMWIFAAGAQAADPPAAKPEGTVPKTPEAAVAIDRDLPTLRKATSPREKITTDIGEVTRLACWFDAGGSLRKIEFTQNKDFEHTWYWTGASGKERPIFAVESGSVPNAAGRRAKYVVRSLFNADGKLTVSHTRGDDESEDVKSTGPLFEAEVELKDLQKSVALLLAEPLRQPVKAPTTKEK